MRISVVGSGYVGLVASACLAELGHHVISVDNDVEKTAALKRGFIPIYESFLPELVKRHHGTQLHFSDDLSQAVAGSDVIFIAVGTPQGENGDSDLSYVESAAREIAHVLDGGFKIIVEKSTVPVLTNEWIRKTLLREGAHAGSFDIASNPEFLREGSAVTDFLYPDRIVIGADSTRCANVMARIYAPLTSGRYSRQSGAVPPPAGCRIPAPLISTSAKSAEVIKHASNAFLATKISFINAVANICESVGADIDQVVAGVGADSRIGGSFLKPGIGYGGSCFPKDLLAFASLARECGNEFRLLDEVAHINEEQRLRFVRKVRKLMWTLRGKRLAVLGLAFKGGTDDIRESPAVHLVRLLMKEGAVISAYDPAAIDRARELFAAGEISFAASAYDAAKNADALLILTDWEEFAALDLDRLFRALRYPIILDGRNMYKPEVMVANGFTYASVGRPDATPKRLSHAPSLKATSAGSTEVS